MTTTRREFLGSVATSSAGIGIAACSGTESKPWNVVWIIADDLSPDLSCYGNTDVTTPNIDRLAAEGARFTNAYVTGPVCSASRSAMITGMYQTSIGRTRIGAIGATDSVCSLRSGSSPTISARPDTSR